MNDNDALLLSAQLRTDLPTLDLHGKFSRAVPDEIELFVSRLLEKNERAGRIIFGGGTGALRQATFDCLQKSSTLATLYDEGGSVLILIL